MPIIPKNLVRHELIGLHVEIVGSSDQNKIGLQGTVIKETKGMLTIETKNGEKRIPKKECTFVFILGNSKIKVNGELLVGRPEERIKIKG